jgi:hypothetical protein
LKYFHQPVFGVSAHNLKRDPMIESIIESRKSMVIENAYTQLAQITSQSFRSSQHISNNSFKPHSMKPKTDNQVHFSDTNNSIQKNENYRTLSSISTSTISLDNDRWDDGLNAEYDKGKKKKNY